MSVRALETVRLASIDEHMSVLTRRVVFAPYRGDDVQPEIEAGDRKLELRAIKRREANFDGAEVTGLRYAT